VHSHTARVLRMSLLSSRRAITPHGTKITEQRQQAHMASDVDRALYGRDIDQSEAFKTIPRGGSNTLLGPCSYSEMVRDEPRAVGFHSGLNRFNRDLGIESAISTTWGDRVKAPPTPVGVHQSSCQDQGCGFWELNGPRKPHTSHAGLRTQYIKNSYAATGGAFGGYKRANTPPVRGTRDPSLPIRKSKVGRQMLPVDTVTAINGRPIDYPEVGRRGPACPDGVLAANLAAEKRRRCEWTDGMMQYKVAPKIKVPNASAERLEAGPLYSSFGLAGSPHIKYFNPSAFMPKRWVAKMMKQGRIQELKPPTKEEKLEAQAREKAARRRGSNASSL